FVLDKETNINFIDSLNIKQIFIPIDQDVWLPSNVQLDFSVGLLGFQVNGYFTAVYQNYELVNDFDKKAFKEVLRIGKDVNEKEADYWASVRPVPLTEEENKDYVFKDSIQRRNNAKAYLDSLDRKNNRFKPLSSLVSGYSYRNR